MVLEPLEWRTFPFEKFYEESVEESILSLTEILSDSWTFNAREICAAKYFRFKGLSTKQVLPHWNITIDVTTELLNTQNTK